MRSKWITHKGTRILYIDISNLKQDIESLQAELKVAASILEQETLNSVLVLADIRNTTISKETTAALKNNAPRMVPFIRKNALVVQATGFRKVILDSIGRFVGRAPMWFDDIEKAKNWLVDG